MTGNEGERDATKVLGWIQTGDVAVPGWRLNLFAPEDLSVVAYCESDKACKEHIFLLSLRGLMLGT